MKKLLLPALVLLGALALAALLIAGPRSDRLAAAGSPLGLVSGSLGSHDYQLPELRYFRQAVAHVRDDYVAPGRVQPDKMLDASLARVARVVPEFLFERADGRLKLTMGAEHSEVPLPPLGDLSSLSSVLMDTAEFVDKYLPDDIERPVIEYALMNGMLATLDPHSVFIDPESFAEMQITNTGHFGGLGITIGIREQRLTVLYPLAETPAAKAGLKAGDRIDRIGRESTVNMTLQEAVSKLRGEVGTPVTITVSREGVTDREVRIERAEIKVPSVRSAYAGDGVGLVQLTHFQDGTSEKLELALDELEAEARKDGHDRLAGVVLDLRGNPGGYLQEAIKVADKFLRSGVIVSTDLLAQRDRDVRHASKFGTDDKLPLVVLVDQGSASASEIVAGALKNHDRAAVLGVRTFGKGSVQNLYDRDFHEGALKLTIAQYLTPGDVSIQGQGILPDVELRPALVRTEEDGESVVSMFWQDFELREEDLDNPFAWGNQTEGGAVYTAIYACPECWDSEELDRQIGAADHVDDVEVKAAKALLLATPSKKRSDMLAVAPRVLDQVLQERTRQLVRQLEELGIDWSEAPDGYDGTSRVEVEMEVKTPDGRLTPGQASDVQLTVKNVGDTPVYRLRATTDNEDQGRGLFEGHEYFFGKLGPGEVRTFAAKARPSTWLFARTDQVKWHFFSDGGTPPPPHIGRLQVESVPHPRFAFGYQVVDDGSGTSRGNGDGLLQAGESIDLLVTVRNIGEGPTSDRWLAERADKIKDEDKGSPVGPNGFVSLKNKSGAALFLVDGTAEFSLAPGEQSTHRLQFRVADDVGERSGIAADLSVGDSKFWEIVSSPLELPLYSESEPVAAVSRRMKVKGDASVVRGGASELAPEVGSATGVVEVTGRLGGFMRVQTGWGAPGWVAAQELAPAGGRAEDVGVITALMTHSPPVISLTRNPGGTVVAGDRLIVEGNILDDRNIKDLFVFVKGPDAPAGRKTVYERIDDRTGSHPFRLELLLEPGVNEVEIVARDEQDHRGRLTFGVYREAATAGLTPPVDQPDLR